MKKIILSTMLMLVGTAYSQDISSIEQHRAEKVMQFQANPNTQNYDMRYQKLELNINPENYYISGLVTARLIPNENLSQVVMDLANSLSVSSITKGGIALSFTHQNNQLFITLPNQVQAGELVEIKIQYSGEPSTENSAFTQSTHAGTPIIWTLSEPFGAKDWWPCKDDLTDKIENLEVVLTTPSAYTAVSNGVEVSQTENTNGLKTTHFVHNYPIPAYLVAIAVTNYQIYTQTAGTSPNEFPIVNYLYPEDYSMFLPNLDYTINVMNVFEEKFGTYPFSNEKYGHAQFGWGGGMEHTTVSFMVNFNPRLVAHELAHHWFGNKVTCGTWKDIWLNEAFAEYATGISVEHIEGLESFKNWRHQKVSYVTSAPGGNLYLTDSQAQNSGRIFSGRITYSKGCMVVHMLRKKIGDTAFFQAITNYLNDEDLAYGFAVTEQLKQHLEEASNQDLTEFFNDWVYNQGYPIYTAQAYIDNNQLHLSLSQTTSHSSVDFFEMAVKIRITSSSGQQEEFIVTHENNDEEFIIDTSLNDLASLDIDPDYDIIRQVSNVDLAVDVFDKNKEVSIVPNPFSKNFVINLASQDSLKKWELYDVNGKKIDEGNQTRVVVSNLENGMYFCVIETLHGRYHKKIIKE